ASAITKEDVNVYDGYFTVTLDFGSSAFNGAARWLAIGVRSYNSTGAFTDLVPRQEITPTPYALQTKGIYVDDANNVGIGTSSPGEKLDVDGHINSSSSYKLDGETILSTSGLYNLFVGEEAGTSNTIGHSNSAMGTLALSNNTTGSHNSAMGREALRGNTTGAFNSAMGFHALYNNTTGHANSAMGEWALRNNTIGQHNTAMGRAALFSNISGHYNLAMGPYALYRNTTGGYNLGIGDNANYHNQEGSRNTMIGSQAGRGTSSHSKSGNVFIGYQAGYYETGDNKLYIANGNDDPDVLIYGDFATGMLGLGTTNPVEKLHVVGNVKITQDLYVSNQYFDSSSSPGTAGQILSSTGSGTQWVVPTDPLVGSNTAGYVPKWNGSQLVKGTIYDNGYIGIGKTGPDEMLDVDGHINSSASYKLNGETVLSNPGTGNVFVGIAAGVANTTGNNNSTMGAFALFSNTTGGSNSAMGSNALYYNTTGYCNSAMGQGSLYENTTGFSNSAMGLETLYENTTGSYNSAMGSHALYYNTTGSHNSAIGSFALGNNTTGYFNVGVGFEANLYNQTGSRNTIIGYKAGGDDSPHNKSGNVFIGYRAGFSELGDNKLYIANSDTDSPLIYGDFATGNIGLGTINPEYTLDVRGNRIQLKDDTSGDWLAMRVDGGALDLQFEGGNLYVQGVNDGEHILLNPNRDSHVGIGTTSPGVPFDVERNYSGYLARIKNTSTSAGADVLALQVGTTDNPGSGNDFVKFLNGSGILLGSIEGNGGGGIAYKSTSGDFAEWLMRLDSEEPLEPGDVVGVFGGKISRRTKNADHLLVVSTSPIVLGNTPDEGEEHLSNPVAFIGQAPVKVAGSVRQGDYIVPSGENDGIGVGVAAAKITAEQFGQIIGKAWEDSDEQGVKMVNVTVGLTGGGEIIQRMQQENDKKSENLQSEITQLHDLVGSLLERIDLLEKNITSKQ
ncbi:MAG: hypothetical protein GY869_22435, partial [Planctomycetes bacterium]|nr:hypothetical protein [Planctomycetota bacterium]